MKVCTSCGDAKEYEEFHRGRGTGGRRQPCKKCREGGKSGRTQAHKILSVNAEAMMGECRTCGTVPVVAKRRANGSTRYLCRIRFREWDREYASQVTRFRQYGLTRESFHEAIEAQGGGCAICQRPFDPAKQATHIDHCHATGRMRGILCVACNTALGMIQDSPEILRRMIAYLGAE